MSDRLLDLRVPATGGSPALVAGGEAPIIDVDPGPTRLVLQRIHALDR